MARSARMAAQAPATGGLVTLATWSLTALAVIALGYVVYAMWPRWPDAPGASEAPSLPIVIGDVFFNVPPKAVRQKVQRRAGVQDRVDLAYAWPTLEPAAVVPKPSAGHPPLPFERLFVTIASMPTGMTPQERMKTVYPRYSETVAMKGPDGLSLLPFRTGTPYEGEDLLFDPAAPDHFIVRCTRDKGMVPGSCIYERFYGKANITFRVPRAWLGDWRGVLAGIEKVIEQLQPASK